ncbi:MAG: DUF4388 domain-containing protein [Ardenticatenia bacterium]|nr:DUF4388 domain-containing protein [Ardenticatenia bacterium]
MNVQGQLNQVDVPSVVELARQTMESVVVVLTNGDEQGTIYVERGHVVHAEYGELVGPEAFYHLMTLSEGTFELRPVDQVPGHTINQPWNSLLLDALQYLDEHGLTIGAPLPEEEIAELDSSQEAGPTTGENPFVVLLHGLLEEASAIHGAAIVGTDGLVHAAITPDSHVDEDLTGAVAAAIYALSAQRGAIKARRPPTHPDPRRWGQYHRDGH